MNAIGELNHALIYENCLHNLANCTTRQLELLQKMKEGREVLNGSSHLLNELIYNKHWSSVFIIEIFAILGLILCFVGYRLLKTVLFVSGFTIGFLVVYTFTPLMFNTKVCCGAEGNKAVHLGVSAVIGVVIGILSLNLYRLGVFAVGQCLGLIVALSVLCTPVHVYFDSNVTYGLFMATSCCVFGSLSCKFEKPIVVMTTACGGSLVFLYGVDHFGRTSFSVAVDSLLFRIKDVIFDGLHSEYTNWTYHASSLTHYKALHFQSKAIPVFVIWLALTILGTGVQYKCPRKENSDDTYECPSLLNCCRSSSFSKSDYS